MKEAARPGGSTSGGAVAVADGMVPATLGSDTGGSCRIPAAFCGVVGFKPTSQRVSTRGVFPLSQTLNSVGPLATSVSCCAVIDSILSGGDGVDAEPFPAAGLRLGVVEGFVDEDLEPEVAQNFAAALTRLSDGGVRVVKVKIPEFLEFPHINRNGGFVAAEAHALHRPWLKTRREFYDPWVLARLELGGKQSADDYIDLLRARERMKAAVAERSTAFDALALPTVPISPPCDRRARRPQQLDGDQPPLPAQHRDRQLPRPPGDLVPCHAPGAAPVGFMLMGETMGDRRLLSMARGVEGIVRP